MLKHTTRLRVRYSETDQMGYVYYGNYAIYFEVGRVETMRSAGLNYASLERDHGILMPVLNVHMRYIRPARYDDELSVVTEVRELPDKQIIFHTDILLPDGKISASGRVALVVLKAADHSRIAVPEFIKKIMHPYFEH